MKDYIFLERKTNYPFIFALIVILLLAGIVGKMEIRELELKREIQLRKDVSIHNWIMSDSCSEQLLNARDGVLRIKVK